jgi:hypothetical protein
VHDAAATEITGVEGVDNCVATVKDKLPIEVQEPLLVATV